MLEAFHVFLNSACAFTFKHIFIKCLKHIIKPFISTYPTLAARAHVLLLAVIAKPVLSVSASSAPVELLFSVAGKSFRPDRCRMKDTTFENLIFIKCNKDKLIIISIYK